LDVLRGFALVGILFANILSWSGIKFMPIEEIRALGDFKIDVFLYKLLKFFVDTKFYTIFSLLFGIGFSLQFTKNKNTPGFIPMYLRRLSILFLIGCIHAFFWSGDILTLYAILGFIFVLFRNIKEKNILKIAILFLAFPVALDIVYMFLLNPQTTVVSKEALTVYKDMTPQEVVAGFQSGNWLETLKTNWHNLIWRWYAFIPSGRPFKVLGLFLLGYYLFNNQFFNKAGKRWPTFFIFVIIGLSFTSLSILISGSISEFSTEWKNILYKTVHEIGQISMSFSYIVLLNLLVNKFKNLYVWNVLKAYGRKSMSSYLGHTFLGILVFYPVFGLGYFAKLSLKNVYLVALILLIYQFIFSSIWFKYFAFGPIEWIWKCLTYGKWFPIRIKKESN
jgi:uncharacterized protein